MGIAPATIAGQDTRGAGLHQPDTRRDRAAAHYRPLLIVLAAVCAGIVADRYRWPWPLSFPTWFLLAVAGWAAWFVASRHRSKRTSIAALCIALAAAGAAWHHLRWDLFADDDLGRFASQTPQPICLEGIATAAPREFPSPPLDPLRPFSSGPRSRLIVDVVGIRDGTVWRSAS